LLVRLAGSEVSQTLLPDADLSISYYVISGRGPAGASFAVRSEAHTREVAGLAPGTWVIAAEGFNSADLLVANGEGATVLQYGMNTVLDITVRRLQGYGRLSLEVRWDGSLVAAPAVQATLVPPSGTSLQLPFTMDSAGLATFSSATIPTGYHTVIIGLLDSGAQVAGAVEIARIARDATTTGIFQLQVNAGGGALSVGFTPQLDDPIPVTLVGEIGVLPAGSAATLSATVPPEFGNAVFIWYLNGVARATGASFTVGEGLTPGPYRVDVTAFSADGKRAGSSALEFSVAEQIIWSASLSWDANTEPAVAGYRLYYGTVSAGYGASVDVGLITSYTLGGLDPNQTYYLAATAYDANGQESPKSNEIVVRWP
jgi:hypothetical protein